ncbi:MAG: hypothetical protein RL108_72 [Bacteroidota bacterium]|jgi:hypothetical protein
MNSNKEFEVIHIVGRNVTTVKKKNEFKIHSIDEFSQFIFKESMGSDFKPYLLVNHIKAILMIVKKKDKAVKPLFCIYFAEDFISFLTGVFNQQATFKFSNNLKLDPIKPIIQLFRDQEVYFEDLVEPEQYMYPMVTNRCAVRIEPNKLFIDWLKYITDDDVYLKLESLPATTFLIKDVEEEPKFDKWLKNNYSSIFEIKLNSYCIEPELWPQDRSFRVFKLWFNIGFSDMILNLEKGPIEIG